MAEIKRLLCLLVSATTCRDLPTIACSDDGGRSAVHWAAEIGLLPSLDLLLQACKVEQDRQLAAYRNAGTQLFMNGVVDSVPYIQRHLGCYRMSGLRG